MTWVQLVVGALVTLIAGAGINLFFINQMRDKYRAETTATNATGQATLSDSAMRQVEQAIRRADGADRRAELADRRVDWCRARIDQLEQHIDSLEVPLRATGVEVPSVPSAPPWPTALPPTTGPGTA